MKVQKFIERLMKAGCLVATVMLPGCAHTQEVSAAITNDSSNLNAHERTCYA